MSSVLAWIDHDSKARERTLRILSLFQEKEKESRDELGLGSVRDSFADQLFPGTSTIQTRLRYMLFVPWIYHSLEEKRLPVESFANYKHRHPLIKTVKVVTVIVTVVLLGQIIVALACNDDLA